MLLLVISGKNPGQRGQHVVGRDVDQEAEAAIQAGGSEIDMVVNIGKVLSGDWDYVSEEIKAINDAVTANQTILKVIFENDYLLDEHIIRLCEICSEHRVAFVKTSSGYGFVNLKITLSPNA